ncbi:MAG: hypothetical protein JWM16_177 [Verrucomicrobiales bacterium]|nr:hypothetical protein [Verrucomicrobiales bacterium]
MKRNVTTPQPAAAETIIPVGKGSWLPSNLSAKASAKVEVSVKDYRAQINSQALFPPVKHPTAFTQANPGLAQIHLSYEAQLLSQSDRFRPNLSQRPFRQEFRLNLTCHQIRIGSCPLVVDFSAPMFCQSSTQGYASSGKATQTSRKNTSASLAGKASLPTLRSQISHQ